MHSGLAPARELPVAQILVNECWSRARIATPLDHFLERAAAVETRAGAAPIVTFPYPVRILGRTHAGLQVGKLHLLPQPIDDVVDFEFQHELDFTLVLAALAFLARATLLGGVGKYIARLGLSLARALLFLGTAEPEVIVLQHPHRDAHRARAFIDDISAGDYLRQMLTN